MGLNVVADRIASLPQAPVSDFAKNAHMSLVVCLLICGFVRRYLLDPFLLPRIKGFDFPNLPTRHRTSLSCSVVHLTVRVLAFTCGVPVYCLILAGRADFSSTFTAGGPTFGTILVAFTTLFCAVYLHEILFIEQIPFLFMMHHIATVCIAAFGILYSLDWRSYDTTQAYFMICMLFGLFDCFAKTWTTTSFMVSMYHRKNHRIRYVSCAVVAVMNTARAFIELPILRIIFYSGNLRNRWPLGLRIATPIIYILFLASQIANIRDFGTRAWHYRKAWKRELAEKKSAGIGPVVELTYLESGQSSDTAVDETESKETGSRMQVHKKHSAASSVDSSSYSGTASVPGSVNFANLTPPLPR